MYRLFEKYKCMRILNFRCQKKERVCKVSEEDEEKKFFVFFYNYEEKWEDWIIYIYRNFKLQIV